MTSKRTKRPRWSPEMVKPAAAGASKPTEAPKRRGRGKGAGRTVNDIAVDAHVGARIKLKRSLMGMSQVKLGQAIGLTFQQVQKYERGTNRVGASKLWQLAQVLEVPISFFFDGLDPKLGAAGRTEEAETVGRRLMQLAADFALLTEDERKQIAKLVTAIVTPRRPNPTNLTQLDDHRERKRA